MRHRHSRLFRGLAASIALLATTPAVHAASPSADPVLKAGAPTDPHRPIAQDLVASTASDLSITLTGTLSSEQSIPASLATADHKAAGRTVTIAVLSSPLIDLTTTRAAPYPWGKASVLSAPPATAGRLKAAGIDAVLLATDHALDWGIEGMRATEDALDAVGLARAGTGATASQAAQAAYVDQRDGGGRIAVVSVATSFRPTSQALDQHGAAPGRPGVQGIELAVERLVSPADLASLRVIACRYAHPADPARCRDLPPAGGVTVLGSSFRVAPTPALQGTSIYRINDADAALFLRGIREGKQNADLLVAGIHAAQQDDLRSDEAPAPGFLQSLAHGAITAGADIVMVSGPPAPGPIEIVTTPDGRPHPIFYGLGTVGDGAGLLARSRWKKDGLIVELIPAPSASKAEALAILRRLQRLSQGTSITITRRGRSLTGLIQMPPSAPGDAR